jgi:hypothetical protein
VQANLNANTGTVTARDEPGDKCPNCNSPLWRVTWKDEAHENLTLGEQQVARAVAAEAERDAAREARNKRQTVVAYWCAAAFGEGQASSIEQRGIRLLEEAIEAYQACGASAEMAHRMIDYIFARPAGTIVQELGGVGVTALALANAAGISADDAEAKEVARVLAKPLAHFTARNQAKNDAGFRAAALRTPPAEPAHTEAEGEG